MGGIWLSAVGLAAAAELAERARLVSDPAAETAAREAGSRLLERAEQTAVRGRPRTGRMGPEGVAWLARAHAEWSRVTGGSDPELWRRAVDAFTEATRGVDGYERARCRWRLAEALLGTGDRAGAAEQAALAAATAEAIGALPLHRAVAELVARGRLDVLDARLPRARTTPASALTARELQVLGLLAEGLTNREAGRRLFVSEKTVSVHVSNLLAKLGVRSRTEAVTVAHQRGLLADAVAAAAVSPPAARR
jgi:DNA-binding CsgD family transcriptional regulator